MASLSHFSPSATGQDLAGQLRILLGMLPARGQLEVARRPAFRSSGTDGSPVRSHARGPAREGGQGCGLAARMSREQDAARHGAG